MIKQKDAYKIGHPFQYPKGTEIVYANLTARKSRIPEIQEVVAFGMQYAWKSLEQRWRREFFEQPRWLVVENYRALVQSVLGGAISIDHIAALHDLQHLPIEIRSVREGTRVPIGVPIFTIENTDPRFGWVTNMLETQISAMVWKPITVATIAHRYRDVFLEYARKTVGEGEDLSFVDWQGHDFSMRGMSGLEDAMVCGMAHLTAFSGTDTLPAVVGARLYYGPLGINPGGSVPATEHSIMCAGGDGEGDEEATFRRLLTEVYPTGVVSIVSDTWDFWKVVTETLPALKSVIMEREGKLVIRPDSGDPVYVLCGNPFAPEGSAEWKGLVEVLWEIFGGTTTAAGYKLLDSHIGTIYGDSITLERQQQILSRLKAKGFASFNVVLGIGSYTYQHVTRDTFGMAIKSTWAQINGQPRDLYKAPKTDDGTKFSARGRLRVDVDRDSGRLTLTQGVSVPQSFGGELLPVWCGSTICRHFTFPEVRNNARR